MRKGQELCDGFSTQVKLLFTNSSLPKREKLDGNQVQLMSCGISSPGVGAFPCFPGRFVSLLASSVSVVVVAPNPRILFTRICEFSTATACVLSHVFFPYILSSSQDKMHCTLSLTVCTCTPCQRASFNSTTDSFSWCHDPYTLACKARPSFDRYGTSPECVILIVIVVVSRQQVLQSKS